MRRLRLLAPAQLTLGIPEIVTTPVDRWWSMSEEAQEAVIGILARMIANGVVEEGEEVLVDDNDV
ncbi:MAG: hypothetical protein ACRD0I_01190 [Acidimicrobiales bacterium]